jgi:hypothetical protein
MKVAQYEVLGNSAKRRDRPGGTIEMLGSGGSVRRAKRVSELSPPAPA